MTVLPSVDGKGYTLEAAIPFAAVGIEPQEGQEMLFDLAVDDSERNSRPACGNSCGTAPAATAATARPGAGPRWPSSAAAFPPVKPRPAAASVRPQGLLAAGCRFPAGTAGGFTIARPDGHDLLV